MSVSEQLYQLMLRTYPREFRREYGPEMAQVFRDTRRELHDAARANFAAFWLRTIVDVIRSAPGEHWESLRKEYHIMQNLKRDAIGFLACVTIIVLMFLLLGYARKHEVGSILIFGRALDAIVTAGVVGNLIVFILVKVTRLSALRVALWTLIAVNGILLIISLIIGSRVDTQFSFAKVFAGYAISFSFWLAAHWLWSQIKTSQYVA